MKYIPSGTGYQFKGTKKIIEDENDKHIFTSTRGPLKKKEIHRYEK